MRKSLLLVTGIFIAVASCTKVTDELGNDVSTMDVTIIEIDTNRVSSTEARTLAESLFTTSTTTRSTENTEKEILDLTTISTDSIEAYCHIITYEGGGFLILAGDKRSYPILAYSENNYFDKDAESYPDGLTEWFAFQEKYIRYIQNDTTVDRSDIYKLWTGEEIERFVNGGRSQNEGVSSKTSTTATIILEQEYGPLLSSTWNQDEGYNNDCPDFNCATTDNGRAYTGCVATAMTQIMRYHESPSSYNWSIMPDHIYSSSVNSTGANEIAGLMRDAGNSLSMNYGCDGSSSYTSNVPSALKNSFGYSSATYTSFYHTIVHSEIKNGYPVILRGSNNNGNGHAWICEGSRKYSITQYVPPFQMVITSYFHSHYMNWGWGGSQNGWYGAPEGDGYDYVSGMKMVYNIRS